MLQASTGSGLPELGIVMWDLLREHDYHLLPRSTAQRDSFISVLSSAYYRLLGMDLPVVSVASSAALVEQLAKKATVQARPGDSAAEVLTRRAIVRAAIQSGYTLHARAASIAAAGGCVSLLVPESCHGCVLVRWAVVVFYVRSVFSSNFICLYMQAK